MSEAERFPRTLRVGILVFDGFEPIDRPARPSLLSLAGRGAELDDVLAATCAA